MTVQPATDSGAAEVKFTTPPMQFRFFRFTMVTNKRNPGRRRRQRIDRKGPEDPGGREGIAKFSAYFQRSNFAREKSLFFHRKRSGYLSSDDGRTDGSFGMGTGESFPCGIENKKAAWLNRTETSLFGLSLVLKVVGFHLRGKDSNCFPIRCSFGCRSLNAQF